MLIMTFVEVEINLQIADSALTEYFSTFPCLCVSVSVFSIIWLFRPCKPYTLTNLNGLLGWTWFELGKQDCTQWNVTENHEKPFKYHETITRSMKNQPRVGLHCLKLYGCTWYWAWFTGDDWWSCYKRSSYSRTAFPPDVHEGYKIIKFSYFRMTIQFSRNGGRKQMPGVHIHRFDFQIHSCQIFQYKHCLSKVSSFYWTSFEYFFSFHLSTGVWTLPHAILPKIEGLMLSSIFIWFSRTKLTFRK